MKPADSIQSSEKPIEPDQPGKFLADAAEQAAFAPQFKLGKILIPIDFSSCAKKALEYAIPLARLYHSTVTLVHIAPQSYAVDEYGVVDNGALEAASLASALKDLGALASAVATHGVQVETVVQSGVADIGIVEKAGSLAADLIVISTHGRTGLRHVLLGSVTEHVVRHAPCPVLVVREREHEFLSA